MAIQLPQYEVGDAQHHGALAVFPLFTDAPAGADYELAEEAIDSNRIVVREVSESGSVPDLTVENKGDRRVLFLEGEELVGAKQNRILNTSVLVAAGSHVNIPVSCVERGRWGFKDHHLTTSGSHSTTQIRRIVKASVSQSLKERRGHRSDQGTVWLEVDKLQSSHHVSSDTQAMADVFAEQRDRIAEAQERLPYVDGASGMAVAIGDKVVAVDLFDKPATCAAVWRGMLSGHVLDAATAEAGRPRAADVERLLKAAREAAWEGVEAVGEGEEYRAELGRDHASVLYFEGALVHGSIGAAA